MMPNVNRIEYTAEEERRHGAAYKRLWDIIWFDAPDADVFCRLLDEALAAGFPIDFTNKFKETLLHLAINYSTAVRAGLPQILIEAGADVNVQDDDGETPLGIACWWYVRDGEPEYLTAIDVLLTAGARPELDESWKKGLTSDACIERRDRLEAYINTWRTRGRAANATPAFDYAL